MWSAEDGKFCLTQKIKIERKGQNHNPTCGAWHQCTVLNGDHSEQSTDHTENIFAHALDITFSHVLLKLL